MLTRLWINRIPKVHISEDEEGGKEIELSDDPYDCMRLEVENVPCIVTLCKVPVPPLTGHPLFLRWFYCLTLTLVLEYTESGVTIHRDAIQFTKLA